MEAATTYAQSEAPRPYFVGLRMCGDELVEYAGTPWDCFPEHWTPLRLAPQIALAYPQSPRNPKSGASRVVPFRVIWPTFRSARGRTGRRGRCDRRRCVWRGRRSRSHRSWRIRRRCPWRRSRRGTSWRPCARCRGRSDSSGGWCNGPARDSVRYR